MAWSFTFPSSALWIPSPYSGHWAESCANHPDLHPRKEPGLSLTVPEGFSKIKQEGKNLLHFLRKKNPSKSQFCTSLWGCRNSRPRRFPGVFNGFQKTKAFCPYPGEILWTFPSMALGLWESIAVEGTVCENQLLMPPGFSPFWLLRKASSLSRSISRGRSRYSHKRGRIPCGQGRSRADSREANQAGCSPATATLVPRSCTGHKAEMKMFLHRQVQALLWLIKP